MAHTMSTSKAAKHDEAKVPNQGSGGAASEPREQGTDRPWPGKSEPGHIKPIGPAYRPGSPNSPESNKTAGRN